MITNSHRKHLSAALSGAFLFGSASSGWAHHPVAEQSLGHEQPSSRAELEVAAAGFTLPGGQGNYVSATLGVDLSVTDRIATGVRVPFVVLHLRGNGARAGFGDLDMVGKVRVLGDGGRSLSLGVSVEAPTGDADRGLGSGHFELSPFVTGAWTTGRWHLHATLGDSLSLGGAEHHEDAHSHAAEEGHGTFISPHSDHELQYHAGVLFWVSPAVFANLTLGGATVLVPEELGATFLAIGPELGVVVGGAFRLTLNTELPIAGERRFDWMARAGVEARF